MNDLLVHLQKYGLEAFLCNREQFENMLRCRLGENNYRRLKGYQGVPESRKDTDWAAEYYDFIGHYSRAATCFSRKTMTLAGHGSNIDRILPREGRILEVGALHGWLAAWYALRSPLRQVVGVDVATRCIFEANKKAAAMGITNVKFIAQDFFRIEPQQLFDAVVDTQALCDLEDPGPYFRKLRPMLQANAVFLSVPSCSSEDRLNAYLTQLADADLAPAFVGYHATYDQSEPSVYPMVVAIAGGMPKSVDAAAVFRRIRVALNFVKQWQILLRAAGGPPEVALFIPSVGEDPELVREGDRVLSLNGVTVDDLDPEALNDLYKRDGKWVMQLEREGERVSVCYV